MVGWVGGKLWDVFCLSFSAHLLRWSNICQAAGTGESTNRASPLESKPDKTNIVIFNVQLKLRDCNLFSTAVPIVDGHIDGRPRLQYFQLLSCSYSALITSTTIFSSFIPSLFCSGYINDNIFIQYPPLVLLWLLQRQWGSCSGWLFPHPPELKKTSQEAHTESHHYLLKRTQTIVKKIHFQVFKRPPLSVMGEHRYEPTSTKR